MASSFYELIGRLIVKGAWLRYGHQIKVAGGVFGVLVLIGGYLAANRQPPEG